MTGNGLEKIVGAQNILDAPEILKVYSGALTPWTSFSIVMTANFQAEHEYQEKTLDKILEETEGKTSEVEKEPHFKARDYLTIIRACFIPRLALRCAGTRRKKYDRSC